MPREFSRLTEMHKLSPKDAELHFIVSFSIFSEIASKVTLRSIGDLEVISPHPEVAACQVMSS